MLSTQLIGADLALKVSDKLVLVASKSQPGEWYSFTPESADRCECAGFKWRHHCRHLTIAGVLLADPETRCPLCGIEPASPDGPCSACEQAFVGVA